MPAVLMEESVVKSTQQDQIVEICCSTVGPVLDVMNLNPLRCATSGVLTPATVPMDDETT
jgi:hypothetical protein